jgi:hypothetical protein
VSPGCFTCIEPWLSRLNTHWYCSQAVAEVRLAAGTPVQTQVFSLAMLVADARNAGLTLCRRQRLWVCCA